MNNRLNIQDLAGLLSERTGKDRGEVERFLGTGKQAFLYL